jgi:transposase
MAWCLVKHRDNFIYRHLSRGEPANRITAPEMKKVQSDGLQEKLRHAKVTKKRIRNIKITEFNMSTECRDRLHKLLKKIQTKGTEEDDFRGKKTRPERANSDLTLNPGRWQVTKCVSAVSVTNDCSLFSAFQTNRSVYCTEKHLKIVSWNMGNK